MTKKTAISDKTAAAQSGRIENVNVTYSRRIKSQRLHACAFAANRMVAGSKQRSVITAVPNQANRAFARK